MDDLNFMWVFFGLVFGIIGSILIYKFKKKLCKKNALKKIKEQRMKFIIDGKPYDFEEDIKKKSKQGFKKEIDKVPEPEIIPKKPIKKKPIIKISKSYKKKKTGGEEKLQVKKKKKVKKKLKKKFLKKKKNK